MTAPQLSQYQSGQSTAVNGDQLNTFQQTCDTLAQLRAFVGVQGIQVFVRGSAAAGDGGGGGFYWVPGATGPDDNVSVIVPTGAAIGAWALLPGTVVPSSSLTFEIGGEGSPNGGTLATTPIRYVFRAPYPFSVTDVRVNCSFNSGTFTVTTDVRKNITLPASASGNFSGGTSILTTQPILQAAETTSLTGTPAVVNPLQATLTSDQLCGIRCTFSAAPTVVNFAGLKVVLIGAVG